MRESFKIGLSKEDYETLHKIRDVYGKLAPRFRDKEVINLLETLDFVDNIRLSRDLQSLILGGSTAVSTKANSMLVSIMSDMTIEEIRFADSICRNSYYYHSLSILTGNIDLGTIKNVISYLKNPEYLLCLLSMNANGYYREYAIRELQYYDMEIVLPYIMLRTNDWVEPVKNLAESIVVNYIKKITDLKVLISNVELLESMKEWKRSDLSKVIVAAETKLIEQGNYDQLLSHFESTNNYKIRRILFDYIVINQEDFESNLIRGLKSKDPVIHRKVIALINKYFNEIDLSVIHPHLEKCKSAFARVANVELITRLYDSEKATQSIMASLSDKSTSVREYVRFKLKNFGFDDFSEYYKSEIMKAENVAIGTVLGIGETGKKSDCDLIEPYLTHSNPRIRKAALSSSSNLDIERSYELLIDSLLSSNQTDSKHAKKLLVKYHLVRIEELIELYSLEGFEQHVYENLLVLISYASKWDCLESLLHILSSSFGDRQVVVLEYLETWSANANRSFINLDDNRRETITNLLNQNRGKLGEKLYDRLMFSI